MDRVLLKMQYFSQITSIETDKISFPNENARLFYSVFALGMLAREQNYVKPELVDENVLEISEGRHPILSCYLQSYIPNDTSLASMPGQNLNIIHGPVASGKSLYLKQVRNRFHGYSGLNFY